MPTYDFRCEACEKQEEVFMRLADYKVPDCCGQRMKQIISCGIIGDLEPYVDEHMTYEPVLVKSKKHKRELMKEHEVSERFGKNWW